MSREELEARQSQKLGKQFKLAMPGCIYFKHNDGRTSGIPDISLTWRGVTSWHEVKVADPDFESVGLQELTCCRLAMHGVCDYIIFDVATKEIVIVAPNLLANWRQSMLRFSRFDTVLVAAYVRQLHIERVNL